MTRDLLITAHHAHALAGACDLGCWQPLALRLDDVLDLTHLAVLEPGAEAITTRGRDRAPGALAAGRWL